MTSYFLAPSDLELCWTVRVSVGAELVLPSPFIWSTGINEMDVTRMPLSPGLWIISFFFPYFMFYLFSFSFSPITCIESTLFLILTLTTYELFMPFTLLPLLHVSLTIFFYCGFIYIMYAFFLLYLLGNLILFSFLCMFPVWIWILDLFRCFNEMIGVSFLE